FAFFAAQELHGNDSSGAADPHIAIAYAVFPGNAPTNPGARTAAGCGHVRQDPRDDAPGDATRQTDGAREAFGRTGARTEQSCCGGATRGEEPKRGDGQCPRCKPAPAAASSYPG